MKKERVIAILFFTMLLLIKPFAVEAKGIDGPRIVSITRSKDKVEAYEEVEYTVKLTNVKSGIRRFYMDYFMPLWNENGYNQEGYSSEFEYKSYDKQHKNLISVTDNTIRFKMRANREGIYDLSFISIRDGKNNSVEYYYDSDSGIWGVFDQNENWTDQDLGPVGTWEVLPTDKPESTHMVQLKNITIDDSINKENIQAPSKLTFNLKVAAPENANIQKIEMEYRNDKKDKTYYFVKDLSEPWNPGLDGKDYAVDFDINSFMDIAEYKLKYIRFIYGDNITYYDTYKDKIMGFDKETLREYSFKYYGESDFTIVSNVGEDDTSPELQYIKLEKEGPFTTKDTITYKVGISDAEAGIQSVEAIFKSDKGKEEKFECYLDNGDTNGVKEIFISSKGRDSGKYKLNKLYLTDMVGNVNVYYWNSSEKCYLCWDWSIEDEDNETYVDLKGDLIYTVTKPHECKWNTGKVTVPASFDADGVRVRTCTTCGATKEEPVAKVIEATLSTELYTYDGKVKKPTVTLKDENGKKLSTSSYTVTYSKGRKLPGMYEAKVVLKGNYQGEKPLTFIIQPKAPTSLKATLTDANVVKLTWKSATGADGYHVYYRVAGEEEYTQIGGDVIDDEYVISDLEYGQKYEFKVASDLFFGDDCCESKKTTTTSAYTLKKVEDVKVERSSSTKVKVSWTNISGESGYIIYYKDADGNEKSKTYKTTSGKSTTISVPANEAVEYKVAAYKEISSKKKVIAEPSDAFVFTLRNVKAVKNVRATLDGVYNKVKVTWSSASGATGYNVFVKKDGEKTYDFLAYVTETEFPVDETLEDGKKYTFKVEPVYKDGEEIIARGETDTAVVYVLKAPTSFKVAKSGSKVKVSWKDMSGESGYQVLQNAVEGLGSGIACETTKTSITLPADKNVAYTYQVRAYKMVGGETIYGPSTEVKEYTRK